MRNLNDASAFHIRVHTRLSGVGEIPVSKDFIIPIVGIKTRRLARTGGKAAFAKWTAPAAPGHVNRGDCAGRAAQPYRHCRKRDLHSRWTRGDDIWNDGGKKHTLEWQRGSLSRRRLTPGTSTSTPRGTSRCG